MIDSFSRLRHRCSTSTSSLFVLLLFAMSHVISEQNLQRVEFVTMPLQNKTWVDPQQPPPTAIAVITHRQRELRTAADAIDNGLRVQVEFSQIDRKFTTEKERKLLFTLVPDQFDLFDMRKQLFGKSGSIFVQARRDSRIVARGQYQKAVPQCATNT